MLIVQRKTLGPTLRPVTVEVGLPGVVIVPGIFGVSEYMRETAAELAQNGFAALAVNYFARTPEMANTQDFQKLIGRANTNVRLQQQLFELIP